MNLLHKSIAGLLLGAGFMVYAAPAAEAGLPCRWIRSCGVVMNDKTSNGSVVVYEDWGVSGPTKKSAVQRLYPGNYSKYKDTDGYRSHSTCKTYKYNTHMDKWILQSKGKYYKITDIEKVMLKIRC